MEYCFAPLYKSEIKHKCVCIDLFLDQIKVIFFLILFFKSCINCWGRFTEKRKHLSKVNCPLANKNIGAKGHFKRPFVLHLCCCLKLSYLKVCVFPSLSLSVPSCKNCHLLISLSFNMICMDIYWEVNLWNNFSNSSLSKLNKKESSGQVQKKQVLQFYL